MGKKCWDSFASFVGHELGRKEGEGKGEGVHKVLIASIIRISSSLL